MELDKIEKHCNTLFKIRLEDVRCLWADATENQRLELIKSIIWTAPDMYKMWDKTKSMLLSDEFEQTLD